MATFVRTSALRLHHVAIQTRGLRNSVAWYRDFFGCRTSWSVTDFSPVTAARLPGLTRITELSRPGIRFHLIERAVDPPPPPPGAATEYQHVCLVTDSPDELRRWRAHWQELYTSGRYLFAYSESATEVIVDEHGVQSFYCRDVNGLEFEFTYLPEGR